MNRSFKKTKKSIALCALILFSVSFVSLAHSETDTGWQFAAQLYFWGASIDGTTATGRDINIGLDDILDNLQFALMGTVEAKKDKLLFLADMVYLDVSKSENITPNLGASVNIRSWIVTPMVGYNLVDTEKGSMDLLGGARYLSLDTVLSGNAFGLGVDESGSVWDAIVGVRGTLNLTKNLYLMGLLDAGAGQSDLTWQALGGLGYRFDWFTLVAAYRYMSWEFGSDIKALDNLEVHGPAVGIKFTF